jgi:hypothetical protein
LFYDAIVFFSQNAKIIDSKENIDANIRCQDVIITASGKQDEPVLGWLTNIEVGRLANI